MSVIIATPADLRALIRAQGTRTEKADQQARLTDKSVGGIRDAANTIAAQQGQLRDKTVGGHNAAGQLIDLANAEHLADNSPSGVQRALRSIAAADPLGERQLPAKWDAHARLEDKSVGGVRDAATLIECVSGAALKDKTPAAENRARDAHIAAAMELVA